MKRVDTQAWFWWLIGFAAGLLILTLMSGLRVNAAALEPEFSDAEALDHFLAVVTPSDELVVIQGGPGFSSEAPDQGVIADRIVTDEYCVRSLLEHFGFDEAESTDLIERGKKYKEVKVGLGERLKADKSAQPGLQRELDLYIAGELQKSSSKLKEKLQEVKKHMTRKFEREEK